MRSVLFKIPFAGNIPIGPWQVPLFGFGLLLALWCLVGGFFLIRRLRSEKGFQFTGGEILWAALAVVIVLVPQAVARGLMPAEWPVFGFGLMLFIGFFAAATLATVRFQRRGYDKDIAWDIAFWGVPAGIVGARIFHIIEFRHEFIGKPFAKVFQLWDGGLVFYGGLVGGIIAYVVYCRVKKLDPFDVGDIIIPSLFVGLGFGRIGCFLNGCCYGDFCSLPWSVAFPKGSHPYKFQVDQGYLSGNEDWSLGLHPAQLYSSIDAFILAGLTWAYYSHRQRPGDVIVLGLAGHAVTRFLLELLRNDTAGQFGTSFTISQWMSAALLLAAIALWFYRHRVEVAPSAAGGLN